MVKKSATMPIVSRCAITATKTKRNFNIKSCIRDEIPYCNSIQPRRVFHLLYNIERSSRRVMVRGFLFAVARGCTSEKTTDPDYLSVLIVFMGKNSNNAKNF